MGSKFGKPTGTQKPPAVCRKPPVPMAFPPPPFADREYLAFVQWYEPAYGTDLQLSGPLTVKPRPAGPGLQGWLHAPPYAIRLRMTPAPTLPALTFQLRLYLHGAPIGAKTATLQSPRSLDPFDSGLVQFNVATPKDAAACQVWT